VRPPPCPAGHQSGVDAVRRVGGSEAQLGDYEMNVRYAQLAKVLPLEDDLAEPAEPERIVAFVGSELFPLFGLPPRLAVSALPAGAVDGIDPVASRSLV
jgi:hypothetical protein